MFDSSLQFTAKIFLVFFIKSLQQQQQQAYPQRLYLFVYFLNRTVAFFSDVCNLYSASHVISFPTSIYCMNCFAVSFSDYLLEAPSQSLQEDYLCNLEKLHGMAHNFLLLCRTWNRCCYHSCNLAAAKSKESFGSTNQRPAALISNQRPIKRLLP